MVFFPPLTQLVFYKAACDCLPDTKFSTDPLAAQLARTKLILARYEIVTSSSVIFVLLLCLSLDFACFVVNQHWPEMNYTTQPLSAEKRELS